MKARGISARRASLDVVGNDGLIRDIRAGRLPGVDRLEALFEYLGLEFHFGGPLTGRSALGRAVSATSGDAKPPSGYILIPWHPQSPRPSGQTTAPVAFLAELLDAAGLDVGALAAVTPDANGSEVIALIDTAAPLRDGPAPWCFRQNGRVVLGMVQFEQNITVFLPETREARARVMIGDDRKSISFLGRVVWSGQIESSVTG